MPRKKTVVIEENFLPDPSDKKSVAQKFVDAVNDIVDNPIQIKGGALKDGMFCNYTYEHTIAQSTTNTVKVTSEVPVHEDLIHTFNRLNVHLAVRCEEISPDEILDVDNLPEYKGEDEEDGTLAERLNRFSVSTFKLIDNGENEGVILIGQKRLKTGDYVKLETPVTRFEGQYPFTNELRIVIDDLINEIRLYMEGKQAPTYEQAEFDFKGQDDPQQALRDLHKAAEAGEEED